MGTSFGEVILNRSNLKKQDVSIISDLRQESIGNLGKCEREKKEKYEAIIMGFPARGILTTIKHFLYSGTFSFRCVIEGIVSIHCLIHISRLLTVVSPL